MPVRPRTAAEHATGVTPIIMQSPAEYASEPATCDFTSDLETLAANHLPHCIPEQAPAAPSGALELVCADQGQLTLTLTDAGRTDLRSSCFQGSQRAARMSIGLACPSAGRPRLDPRRCYCIRRVPPRVVCAQCRHAASSLEHRSRTWYQHPCSTFSNPEGTTGACNQPYRARVAPALSTAPTAGAPRTHDALQLLCVRYFTRLACELNHFTEYGCAPVSHTLPLARLPSQALDFFTSDAPDRPIGTYACSATLWHLWLAATNVNSGCW